MRHQADFGFASVDIAGERQQVALFVMSLPYSDALYIQAFPRECTEAFLVGHNRAFRFFGGVPRKIRYDNSKIAVAKITASRERQVTKQFQRLQSHYLFETQFCLVRRANEKGQLECLVDFGRANFLVPVPKVALLAALNETLDDLPPLTSPRQHGTGSGSGIYGRTSALTEPSPINIDFTSDVIGGSASNALLCRIPRQLYLRRR